MDSLPAYSPTPLVGRERELSALQAALRLAGQGQGGVVLLTGEPGIGKTRLALEIMQRARQNGWQVLFGSAYEAEGAPPYLPFSEAIREYVRGCPLSELESQLGAGAAEVAVVSREILGRFPRLADSPSLAPEHERFRLWESVCDFLLKIAEQARGGVLLVLDDLQWADQASLLLLRHLARRAAEGRLLTVGVYRRADAVPGHPLSDVLADLSREPIHGRLVLDPLALQDCVEIVQQFGGSTPGMAVAAALHRETEGNPYFLTELVRHLQAEGHDLSDKQAEPQRWGIPDGIRQVIGKRLARLSAPGSQILQMAAVTGDGFTYDLLEAATGLESDTLLDALDELLQADLIREHGERFQFGHTLVRQTLYRELNAARRARLHRQVAEAMERLYILYPEPHLAELAHHLFQSGGHEQQQKGIGYARRAAQRAVQLLAYEDAVSLLELALGVGNTPATSPPDRCELLLDLGDARRRAGRLPGAMDAFQDAAAAARDAASTEHLARASLGFEDALLAAGTPRQGADDPSIVLQREALARLGSQPSALRARVLAALGRASHFAGIGDEAARATDEAVELARALNDGEALASALRVKSIVMWGPDQPQQRLAVATELMRTADASGNDELAIEGLMWRLRTLLELGEVTAVDAESDGFYQRAEALRDPQYRALALSWKAWLAHQRGDTDASEGLFQQALTLSRTVQSPNLSYLLTAAEIDAARDLGKVELLRQLRAEAEVIAQRAPPWKIILTLVDCDLGNQEAARTRLAEIARGGYDGILRHWLGLRFGSRLAEICFALDDEPEADRLYSRLLPYAQQYVVGDSCLGSLSRYLGLLAATRKSWVEAEQHFRAGLERNEAIGHRLQVAHTLRDLAMMLLRRGKEEDVRAARDYLQRAIASYRAIGAEHQEERTATLLLHLEPTVTATERPAGLTEREIEILQLIANGKTNAQIAEDLVLSVRTVERHITNAYAKIDARGKADATAFVLKHGLATPSSS
ncbi:MAG TPA: AAA family ATPase [Chloroflexota bacterium]|nr:AAA family ATPase [Chloroflexota bacterium]